MRQGPDQEEFKKILDNLATGKFTRENWDTLRTRDLQANFNKEE